MNARRGLPFVVSAPSGTGKTTVCRGVVDRDPGIVFSVSHTTRPRRPNERDGVDYHFVDERAFRRLVEEGGFLEHAEYGGRLYGTSWASLEAARAEGLDVLLEIEIQGAAQVRARLGEAVLVFVLPPSLGTLEQRLRDRGTDTPAVIEQRLALASRELRAARWFDYWVVNDDLDTAIESVLAIVRASRDGAVAEVASRFGRDAARARLDPELVRRIGG